MPKRKGLIWDEMATAETARVSMRMAARGKRERPAVAVHLKEENEEQDAQWLAELVREKRFVPAKAFLMRIQDGPHKKPRDISIPKFWPDQCVHWMLMLYVVPLIMRGMYAYNCGSVPGRGTKYALDAVMKWVRDDPKNCVWCMKLDVAKYYDNIHGPTLKGMFRRIVKDENVLWLLDTIIDSHERGVPIGFYTSQWFANYYLQGVDHFIKEELRVPHYVRYMDDMLLFGPNKRELLRARERIEAKLRKLHLRLKDNSEDKHKTTWAIFKPRETQIVFLGYKVSAIRLDGQKHRYKWVLTMARDNMLRMTRRVKRIHAKGRITPHDAGAIVSYYGMARAGNNWQFEKKWLRPYADFEKAKKVISNANQKQASAAHVLQRRTDGKRTGEDHAGGRGGESGR